MILWKIIPTKSSINAITLFPFLILTKKKVTLRTLRHEYIHTIQQRELLWIGFVLWYYIEMLIRWISGDKDYYRNISFEKEAYQNQHLQDYHLKRKPFNFLKYLNESI